MNAPTLEDLRAWRCPECSGPAVHYAMRAETATAGKTPEGSALLARGIDLGPPETHEVVVARHRTVRCELGHEYPLETAAPA